MYLDIDFNIYLSINKSVNALKHCSYSSLVWLVTTFFFFFEVLNRCYSATLVCSSGIVATITRAFFFFPIFCLYYFFLLNIYKNPRIYCYTGTTNFTIFSQLLRYQFFICQNKIIKYETVTNHN